MVKQCIVESISPRHVGRLLQEAQLKPHQIRYWLTPRTKNLTPKSVTLPSFTGAIERAKLGERTVCIDEMTGIQALERLAPDLPLRPGKVQRREFEYIRHGTQSLIANFDVATGQVICGDTRTEVDFAAHVRVLIESEPDAKNGI